MTLPEFHNSLQQNNPPAEISIYLQALWYDGKENWDQSHDLIQDETTKDAAWIHAYLHRKEGDRFNANYWYNRAGRTMPSFSLKEEWENLVEHFL